MKDGTIGLVRGDRKNLVSRVIMDVTDSPFSHTRIYVLGWTVESTVWKVKGKIFPRSGVYLTRGIVPSDLYLAPKVDRTAEQAEKGLVKAIALVNSRAWYAYLLTLFDIVLYPTRGFWKWIYKKTGWAPFTSSRTNCSFVADMLEKAMGLDLWPKMPESLTVPGDYPENKFLEEVGV